MTDELAMAAAAAVPIPETATAARTTTEPPVEPGDDGEDEEEDVKEKALAPLPVTYGTPASLQHLRDLEHGWDGDDAPAPSDTAIRVAEQVLDTQPRAVPTLDGGVQLEWPNGIEITIGSEGTQELE